MKPLYCIYGYLIGRGYSQTLTPCYLRKYVKLYRVLHAMLGNIYNLYFLSCLPCLQFVLYPLFITISVNFTASECLDVSVLIWLNETWEVFQAKIPTWNFFFPSRSFCLENLQTTVTIGPCMPIILCASFTCTNLIVVQKWRVMQVVKENPSDRNVENC